MKQAHPYEEVAFDIYPLSQMGGDLGLGRRGRLTKPSNLKSVIAAVKRRTGLKRLTIVQADGRRMMKTAAVCPGSCRDLTAQIAGKVDLYVTGELRHHDALLLQSRGTNAIALGHGNSERPALKHLAKMIQHALPPVTTFISTRDDDPIHSV